MTKLGEICTKITDGSHNPPQGIPQSDFLMLSSKNIEDDNITFDDPRYLCESDYQIENQRTQIKSGDLLMTIVGTVGRVAIVPDGVSNICLQRSVAVIKPKSDIIVPRFLMYQLQNMRPVLEREARGVAQKGIYLRQVSELPIQLLSLEEQRKIAVVLDKVSDLIALRKQQLEKLDELVKARFVEMFGDIADEQFLGDISEFVTVGIANSATHAYTEEGIVMLRNQNIKENYLDDSDLIYIAPNFAAKYETKKLKENDILVIRTGYPGVACLVPAKYEGCQTFTTLIIRLKKSAGINPAYICNYINSEFGKRYVEGEKVGVAQQNFGAKALAKMPIKIPGKTIQDNFADFIKQIDKSKLTVQRSLDKLELVKKALMQEYFG